MIRKQFMAAAAGVAASLAAAGGALAANPFGGPVGVYTPGPGPTPSWRRGKYGSDRNLRMIYRQLERVIDELQRDQHDYCGHREQALDLLTRAREQLQLGLACDQGGEPTGAPYIQRTPIP